MLYIEDRGNKFLRNVGDCRLDNKMLDKKTAVLSN